VQFVSAPKESTATIEVFFNPWNNLTWLGNTYPWILLRASLNLKARK
jgi:hypothetical protein